LRARRTKALALVVALLLAGSARADIDSGAYDAGSAAHSKQARERLRQQIEEEARETAERERLEADLAAQREAAARAWLEARPYPVRLLERRCTECHPAERYAATRHTEPGWHLVLSRMEWLNGAAFSWGERTELVRYLAGSQGLSGSQAALELSAIGAPALLLLATPWLARRRRRGAVSRPSPPSPG
jgi:hypothetical protein